MREGVLIHAFVVASFAIGCSGSTSEGDVGSEAPSWDGTLVQYGTMHEAIGQGQDQGRVKLARLVERPHFYGVAALEALRGEVTIHDGAIVVTGVGENGAMQPATDIGGEAQATLLIGAYVPRWTELELTEATDRDGFDETLANAAAAAGVDSSKPFVFIIEGEFVGLSMHVINGACPLRARMHNTELPSEQKPFEAEISTLEGTLIGIYAPDAVGELTHPDTSTHTHVMFVDEISGETVTGHVERVGLAEGAMLRLPA